MIKLLFSFVLSINFCFADVINIAGRDITITANTKILSAYAEAGKFTTFFDGYMTRYEIPAGKTFKFIAARINNVGGSAGKFAIGNAENVVTNTSVAANLGGYKEPLNAVQDYLGYFPGGYGTNYDFLLRDYIADPSGSPSLKYLFMGAFDTSIHVLLVGEEI